VRSGYLLVGEDGEEIRGFVALLLETEGHAVRTAASGPRLLCAA
jgi:CheY-like chemotaxis protein